MLGVRDGLSLFLFLPHVRSPVVVKVVSWFQDELCSRWFMGVPLVPPWAPILGVLGARSKHDLMGVGQDLSQYPICPSSGTFFEWLDEAMKFLEKKKSPALSVRTKDLLRLGK